MSTLLENVDKVVAAHTAIGEAIKAKGVTVPEGTKLSGMPPLIEQIQTPPDYTSASEFYRYKQNQEIAVPPVVYVDFSEATNLNSTFSGCDKLTSLTLPDGFGQKATNLNRTFSGCTALTALELPEGFGKVAGVLNYCFYRCSSLTTLTLPTDCGKNATDIRGCFGFCSNLTSLTLPSGFGVLTTNVLNCFNGCEKLTELVLP